MYDGSNSHEGCITMKKIGICIDYGNICTNYNTVYLDRDNNDPNTVDCMNKVMHWLKPFLSELMKTFEYGIYRFKHEPVLKIEEIVKKRFLFYSLEKALTAQTFVLQTTYTEYESLTQWATNAKDSLLVRNDDEGEGMYFYFEEHSTVHEWFKAKIKEEDWDEIPFSEV